MDGVINIAKPPGMTSSDVVTGVRRLLGQKKVGHAGTLDPAAAGVLLVCLGRATRISEYLMDAQKTYYAEITFGLKSDTYDLESANILPMAADVSEQGIDGALSAFRGEIEQAPPGYSAVRVNGKKAYELARAGQEVSLNARPVTVYAFEKLRKTGPDSWMFQIECSKGTYVRALARDLGAALGCEASLTYLTRSAIGRYRIEDAVSLEEMACLREENRLEACVHAIDSALGAYQALELPAHAQKRLYNGMDFWYDRSYGRRETDEERLYRVYCAREFIGLGRVCADEGKKLQVRIVKRLCSD